MKRINQNIGCVILLLGVIFCSCNKMLDLKPQDTITDAAYWRNGNDFKLFANQYYSILRNFNSVSGSTSGAFTDNPHHDNRADMIGSGGVFATGTNTIPQNDNSYTLNYTRIRSCNYLLQKAANYTNQSEIAQYVAEAKFFRAYCYYDLLQLFGAVPLVTKVLDTESEELWAPKASRDEVVDQIISDLEAAIPNLPASIAANAGDFGRVTRAAAQAFLGRVTLYEGTWQKFRDGNATRYNALLDKSIAASNSVITSNQYALFGTAASNALGGNSTVLGDSAMKYMFILENPKSNPAGVTKVANHEYILSYRYDDVTKQIGSNVSRNAVATSVTQKFMNNFLSKDGLPIEKSGLFQGFNTYGSQFVDRDNRLKYTVKVYNMYYWYGNFNYRINWSDDATDRANSTGKVSQVLGYGNQKWITERNCKDGAESEDYPVIRYAEVLLNYAEAVFERNGAISDADLDKSLNLVRLRANQNNGMPKLSNAFVNINGLDMRTEIRRERNVELFFEYFRFDDVKRWHTANVDFVTNTGGTAYGNAAGFVSAWPVAGRYKGTQAELGPNQISPKPTNALDANGNIIIDQTARLWTEKNYLYPLPSGQINLNPNLEQNPGWK